MSELANVRLLADYNQWMNDHLYSLAAGLGDEELKADRGAFFGSLFGTFNHLLVADIIWLKRFARHPALGAGLAVLDREPQPAALDSLLHDNFADLHSHRCRLDPLIVEWLGGLREPDLGQLVSYRNMAGQAYRQRFGSLLLHFFNHQTHHRGQITTLLTQAGAQVGVTDLLVRIPEPFAAS